MIDVPQYGYVYQYKDATLAVLGTLRSSTRATKHAASGTSKLLLYRPRRSSTQGQRLVRGVVAAKPPGLPEVDGISPDDWSEAVSIERLEQVLEGFRPAAGLLLPVVDYQSIDDLLGCTSAVWQRWLRQPRSSSYTVASPDWHRAVLAQLEPPPSSEPSSSGGSKKDNSKDNSDKAAATPSAAAASTTSAELMCIGPGFVRRSAAAPSPMDRMRSLLSGAV